MGGGGVPVIDKGEDIVIHLANSYHVNTFAMNMSREKNGYISDE